MSERRSIIIALEIEGYKQAVTSRSGFPLPDLSWATSTKTGVVESQFPQSFSYDVVNKSVTSGGASIVVREAHELLKINQSVSTFLSDDVSISDTTINVDDTSSFSSSGVFFMGTEAIPYSGKTATSFTGCVRSGSGKLGTTAREFFYNGIGDLVDVTQEPDGIINRRVKLHWFDVVSDTLFASVSGWVQDVFFDGDNISLDVIGITSRLANPIIGKGPFGRGILLGGKDQNGDITESLSGQNAAFLLSDDELPLLSATRTNAIKIGDEVIGFNDLNGPAVVDYVYQAPFATSYNGSGFTVRKGTSLRAGMPISYVDSVSGSQVSTTIAMIEDHPSIPSLVVVAQENGGIYPTPGLNVETTGLFEISPLFRGSSGSEVVDHSGGDEFSECSILRGSFPQIVLQLLSSGNGGGSFDTLGKGIGAEIPDELIDINSFNSLPSVFIEIPIFESITPDSILKQLSLLTGAYISPTRGGLLTAVVPDFYPARSTPRDLSNLDLVSKPNWSVSVSKILNAITVNHPTRQIAVASTVSFDRYDQRVEQMGEVLIPSQIPVSLLSRIWLSVLESKKPRLSLQLVVRERLDLPPQPGEIVTVSMPSIPDLQGANEISNGYFVIVGSSSNEGGSSLSLDLLSVSNYEDFGYVAPTLLVDSVSGLNVTVEVSEFSPDSPPVGNWSNIGGNGGIQDSDWFIVGDPVEIIDESTSGSSPVTATSTITAINTSTSVVSLSSVPAWLASGDIIRLADYPATLAGPHSNLRIDWYCPAAPITGLDPKQYGV